MSSSAGEIDAFVKALRVWINDKNRTKGYAGLSQLFETPQMIMLMPRLRPLISRQYAGKNLVCDPEKYIDWLWENMIQYGRYKTELFIDKNDIPDLVYMTLFESVRYLVHPTVASWIVNDETPWHGMSIVDFDNPERSFKRLFEWIDLSVDDPLSLRKIISKWTSEPVQSPKISKVIKCILLLFAWYFFAVATFGYYNRDLISYWKPNKPLEPNEVGDYLMKRQTHSTISNLAIPITNVATINIQVWTNIPQTVGGLFTKKFAPRNGQRPASAQSVENIVNENPKKHSQEKTAPNQPLQPKQPKYSQPQDSFEMSIAYTMLNIQLIQSELWDIVMAQSEQYVTGRLVVYRGLTIRQRITKVQDSLVALIKYVNASGLRNTKSHTKIFQALDTLVQLEERIFEQKYTP